MPITDENIFIAAACKEKGIRFLKGEAEVGVRKIDPNAAAPAAATGGEQPSQYSLSVNGKDIFLAIEDNVVTVDGKVYQVAIKSESGASPASSQASGGATTDVVAQMPGAVYKQLLRPGDRVNEGDPILILEAMKMEMEVPSPVSGTVQAVNVGVGDQVTTGQVLATIG